MRRQKARIYPVIIGECKVCKVPMMSKIRFTDMDPAVREARHPGVDAHGGHGLCRRHHHKELRYGDPEATLPRYRHPKIVDNLPCKEEGCDRLVKSRLMCKLHYERARIRGDFVPKQRLSADEVLDEWSMIRDHGDPDLAAAAARIGMTRKALEGVLYRAQKRGDKRGSRVPFGHDMRSAA